MASIARTRVTLRISGDGLDPDEVGRILRAAPTDAARKGDVRRSSTGREVVARTGRWHLSLPDLSPGDLDAQVRELLARVTGDLAAWRALADRHACDVFCGVFLEDWNEGGSLAPGTLLMLGERGLRLDLDVYGPAGGDGEPAP